MIKVKICGVTRVADALQAAEEGADYVGLIFAPSPRRVDLRAAQEIVAHLPADVEPVGVFLNQPLDEVRRTLERTGIRVAQLHGQESPEYCRRLGVPVIKTFDTYTEESLERLKTYDAFAYLLDVPKGAGTRSRIDPDWARLAKRHGRVFLAGKLTAETVGDLVARVRPFGVDVCSATEKSPGVKDFAKVRAFIRAAREAHRHSTRIKVRLR
ncbi:MAG: phosphoribosylanthranilate isomerase [Planctomycetota bacterium]